jgi:hypothetical protein
LTGGWVSAALKSRHSEIVEYNAINVGVVAPHAYNDR